MDEWIEQKKREEWERDHFHLRKPFLHIKSWAKLPSHLGRYAVRGPTFFRKDGKSLEEKLTDSWSREHCLVQNTPQCVLTVIQALGKQLWGGDQTAFY